MVYFPSNLLYFDLHCVIGILHVCSYLVCPILTGVMELMSACQSSLTGTQFQKPKAAKAAKTTLRVFETSLSCPG
jgi:hypothetical protein